MKVTLTNRDYLQENFFKQWGEFACTCYDTDKKYSDKVGKSCLKSGHYSGCRGIYFNFLLEDIPRFTADQLVRHEQGVYKNMQSFRYVNKYKFDYFVPKIVKDNYLAEIKYNEAMDEIKNCYKRIVEILHEDASLSDEEINQSARGILPMATLTTLSIGFTLEGLINLAHKRLCVRAEENIREVAKAIIISAIDAVPELKEYLVPQCKYLNRCPEGTKGCGRY